MVVFVNSHQFSNVLNSYKSPIILQEVKLWVVPAPLQGQVIPAIEEKLLITLGEHEVVESIGGFVYRESRKDNHEGSGANLDLNSTTRARA